MLESLNQTLAAWLVLLAVVILFIYANTHIEGLVTGGPFGAPGPPTPCSNGICQDSVQDDFDNGTYNQTFYNATEGYVQLNETYTNGTFKSRIFDTSAISNWTNISWTSVSSEIELGEGGENMTGNVLLMHLNNDSLVGENDTLVYDYSPAGNNGTWSGTQDSDSGWNCTDSRLGNCTLMFDGSGDFVNITDDDSLDFGAEDFALEYWFRAFTTASGIHIWKRDSAGTDIGYQVWLESPGNLTFAAGWFGSISNYTKCSTQNNTYADGQWHHMVAQRVGDSLEIHIDAVNTSLVCPFTGLPNTSNLDNPEDFYIGKSPAFVTDFNGTIDEVAVFNRSLSAEEVRDHYDRTALSLTVRSCDDSNCIGDAWNATYKSSPKNLSAGESRFFQYRADFPAYAELYNVTIWYSIINELPVTEEMILNSTSGDNYTTDDLHCWARGTDAENATLAAWWQWWNGTSLFLDGYIPGLSNDSMYEVATLGSGNTSKGQSWNCSVLFFDGELNESAWNNRSLAIRNTPPAISPAIPDQNRGSGTYWSYDANATDPDVDDGTDTLSWYTNNTMLSIDASTGLISDTPQESENGTYTIRVNVTDGTAWDTSIFAYTINDATPPTWHSDKTNDSGSTKTGESVYFNITLRDGFGPGQYIFSFYNGTGWVNDSAQAWTNNTEIEVVKPIPAAAGQTVSWYWWFNDSSGNPNVTDTWSFTVANTVPQAQNPVLNASDDPLNRTTGTLQAFWTFYDSDTGHTQQAFHTKWYNNSAEEPGLENQTAVTSGNTTKGQVWNFSVRVYDGTDWSGWNSSSTLTILNTPPGHTQPVLNSSSGNDYTSDDLYCWNQSSDDDNDPVTNRYRWYKDGNLIDGFENQTVIPSANTSVGEAWICEVTPSDDEEAGTPLNSSSLTIQSVPAPPPPPAPGGPTRVIPTPNYIINITKYPSVIELLRGDSKTFSVEVRNTGDTGLSKVKLNLDSDCPGCKLTAHPADMSLLVDQAGRFSVTVNAEYAAAGTYSLTLTALCEEKANATRQPRLKVLLCKPGSKRCMGSNLETCSQDGFSWTPEHCEHGCDKETLACNKPPVIEYPIPPEVGWVWLIWIAVAVVGAVYVAGGYREHRERSKKRRR